MFISSPMLFISQFVACLAIFQAFSFPQVVSFINLCWCRYPFATSLPELSAPFIVFLVDFHSLLSDCLISQTTITVTYFRSLRRSLFICIFLIYEATSYFYPFTQLPSRVLPFDDSVFSSFYPRHISAYISSVPSAASSLAFYIFSASFSYCSFLYHGHTSSAYAQHIL